MKDFKAKTFQNKNKKIVIFHGLCKGCGLCLVKCPVGAISFSTKDVGIYSTPTVEINLEKCIECGLCELTCPDSALKMIKGKIK